MSDIKVENTSAFFPSGRPCGRICRILADLTNESTVLEVREILKHTKLSFIGFSFFKIIFSFLFEL